MHRTIWRSNLNRKCITLLLPIISYFYTPLIYLLEAAHHQRFWYNSKKISVYHETAIIIYFSSSPNHRRVNEWIHSSFIVI